MRTNRRGGLPLWALFALVVVIVAAVIGIAVWAYVAAHPPKIAISSVSWDICGTWTNQTAEYDLSLNEQPGPGGVWSSYLPSGTGCPGTQPSDWTVHLSSGWSFVNFTSGIFGELINVRSPTTGFSGVLFIGIEEKAT